MAAVALVAAACGGDDDAATAGDEGTGSAGDLPGEEFVLSDGTTTTVEALLDGKPMVVNFFASWCAPCRAEMPDFQAVYADVGDEVDALTKGTLVRHTRAVLPYIGRVSGAVLLLSGTYITFYWAANLRDPLAARGTTFRTVESLQTWIADQLSTRPTFWAAVLGAVITAATAYALWSRRTPAAGKQDADGEPTSPEESVETTPPSGGATPWPSRLPGRTTDTRRHG